MAIIALTQGKFAVVNAQDYNWLSLRKWHFTANGYAATRVKTRIYYMHELLLPDCPAGMLRDHIDRDKLNNRRENLRFVTHQENMLNVTRRKYQGISFDHRHGKFKCYFDEITPGQPKRRVTIGTFLDRETAYKARQDYIASRGL